MAWIWSDELAEAAEAAGLEHQDIASWRRRPVAFAMIADEHPEDLARHLLGIPARRCGCDRGQPSGAPDAGTDLVLPFAPESVLHVIDS